MELKQTISINIHKEVVDMLKEVSKANDRSISYTAESLICFGYVQMVKNNRGGKENAKSKN